MKIRSGPSRNRESLVTVRSGRATNERVRLSVYDLMPGTFATHRTFYYHGSLDATAMRESLTRTLAHYPMLTGRLERDADRGLTVVCGDAGIPFFETFSDLPMPDYGIDRSARPDLTAYLCKINPFRTVGHDTPLLTVKVTHMRGGGSVLGVGINHSIVDGSAYLEFLQHWSRTHRGLDHRATPYPRTALNGLGAGAPPEAELRNGQYTVVGKREKFAFIWRINAGSRRIRTITERFSSDEVEAIKEAASASRPGAGAGHWVSAADALSAHLWKVLAQLRARPDADMERLGMVVGVRSALRDVLPDGFWGNAITNITPALPAAELRGAPLPDVAEAVRAGIEAVTAERVRDEVAFLDAQRRAKRLPLVLSQMALDSSEGTVALNNVGKLPVYEIEFGAGRPFWFQYPTIPIPWTVLVTPTPLGGYGRDVHLSVPQEAAEALGAPEWTKRLHTYAPDR